MIIDGAAKAIDFYKKGLGATESMRVPGPGGKVMHAEIKIGDSIVMLADEVPDMGYVGPKALGGSPVSLMVYVKNVDAQFAAALKAGAEQVKPLQDQFYGDRSGTLRDPFGHIWTLATHIEDVAPDELDRRMKELSKKKKGSTA
jgi:PhnB protein